MDPELGCTENYIRETDDGQVKCEIKMEFGLIAEFGRAISRASINVSDLRPQFRHRRHPHREETSLELVSQGREAEEFQALSYA